MSQSPCNVKHTPGPWDHVAGHVHAEIQTVNGERLYPTVAIVDHSTSRWEDNAHLIAAAPELLEALRGLYGAAAAMMADDISDITFELNKARAAIAKAEGSAHV